MGCYGDAHPGDTLGADLVVLFFSSSRRHTIFSRDWSSDVCSSDLGAGDAYAGGYLLWRLSGGSPPASHDHGLHSLSRVLTSPSARASRPLVQSHRAYVPKRASEQIGRASCRESGVKVEARTRGDKK